MALAVTACGTNCGSCDSWPRTAGTRRLPGQLDEAAAAAVWPCAATSQRAVSCRQNGHVLNPHLGFSSEVECYHFCRFRQVSCGSQDGQQGQQYAAEQRDALQEWLRVLQQRGKRGSMLGLLQGHREEEAGAPHQHARQL